MLDVHGEDEQTVREILEQSTVNGTFGLYKILNDSFSFTGMSSVFLMG